MLLLPEWEENFEKSLEDASKRTWKVVCRCPPMGTWDSCQKVGMAKFHWSTGSCMAGRSIQDFSPTGGKVWCIREKNEVKNQMDVIRMLIQPPQLKQ